MWLVLWWTLLSPAGAEEFEKLAPYGAIAWQDQAPRVLVDGRWYALLGIDGAEASELVAFCQRRWLSMWKKRFEEDLVEVMSAFGSPPGAEVALRLRNDAGAEQVRREAMTRENRDAIWASTRVVPAPIAISRARAEADLDALGALLDSRFAYRDLRGVDVRTAVAIDPPVGGASAHLSAHLVERDPPVGARQRDPRVHPPHRQASVVGDQRQVGLRGDPDLVADAPPLASARRRPLGLDPPVGGEEADRLSQRPCPGLGRGGGRDLRHHPDPGVHMADHLDPAVDLRVDRQRGTAGRESSRITQAWERPSLPL